MASNNKQHTRSDDHLDRMLDSALAKYARIEPRARLEERILAHLHAGHRPSRNTWLQWVFAGTVAAIAVIAVFAWRSGRAPQPVIANHPPATIQRPSIQEAEPTRRATNALANKRASMRKAPAHRMPASPAVAKYPKLDQFPSPQPLSVEEITLADYVRNFPKEAQLVAQAQEEFELETQKVMNDAGADTRPSDSIQQER